MSGREKTEAMGEPRRRQQQQHGPSYSSSDGDFLLQLLRKHERPASASTLTPSSPMLPSSLEFVDPAVAALGPSHPLVPTFPHHDHFQQKPLLPHHFPSRTPPGFPASGSRGSRVESSVASGGPGFVGEALGREFSSVPAGSEWNRGWSLRFGTIGCEVDHQRPLEFGGSQPGHSGSAVKHGESFANGVFFGEKTYGGGFGGYAGIGGANQGFPAEGVTNLGGGGGKGVFQSRNLNSEKGMSGPWVAKNERGEWERPKERREVDGLVQMNSFKSGKTNSVLHVHNPNAVAHHVELHSKKFGSSTRKYHFGTFKDVNKHVVEMEQSIFSSRSSAVADGRCKTGEARAGGEEKTVEQVNGAPDSDKIDGAMRSSVLGDQATDDHSRNRRDGYGGKGKLQEPAMRMRRRKRDLKYRSDLEIYTPLFRSIFESLIPAEEEKAKQKQLLMVLEKLVTKEWPNARLHLYGSCANTFGFPKSDIDVCLSIDDCELSKPDILLRLVDILQSDNLQNVQALTRARVPIVKLMDPITEVSCDICVNNALAVVNTKLLRDYAKIDIRLRQLAFIVKHWAKARQVNETYRGTLSSYAYVLMCIHFLQLRRPAILPCLQKMTVTYVETVDGIQCAYYDKVEELQDFGSQNKETIGQLLCGFFHYWAYGHDYANSVISVRMGGILSKREKDWTRRIGNDRHLICIEDPFEISHDLGRVVDKYSIKVLRDEFERAADVLQDDPNPSKTLFEPYTPC